MSKSTVNMRFVRAGLGTFLIAFPAMVLIHWLLF